MQFDIIICTDNKNGFAKNGEIPWKISEDYIFFKNKTTYTDLPFQINVLIMGRKTFQDLPKTFKTDNRLILILSKTIKEKNYFENLDECLNYCNTIPNINNIFIYSPEI